jgi:hypothetical protein
MERPNSCYFERGERLFVGLAAVGMALHHFGDLTAARVGAVAQSLARNGLIGCGLFMLTAGGVRMASTRFACVDQLKPNAGPNQHVLKLSHLIYLGPLYHLISPHLGGWSAIFGELIYRGTPLTIASIDWFSWQQKEGGGRPNLVTTIGAINHAMGSHLIGFPGQMLLNHSIGFSCESLSAWEQLGSSIVG